MSTALTIQLDPVAIREATTQAILGTLTPELRSKIIETSIRNLLTVQTNPGYGGKSPLQEAFDSAVRQVAREVVEELVKSDESIRQAVQGAVERARQQIIDIDQAKLGQNIADALVRSIETKARDRY